MKSIKEDKNDKWLYRQNARRKMIFGVEESITYGPIKERLGTSKRRHYVIHNPSVAKRMVRENIEVLKMMRSQKYLETLALMRVQALEFYSKIKSAK